MKKAIIATLLSGAISVPAFAANGNDLADANLIFNMENDQSMELAALSSEEMKETQGEFLPLLAIVGAGAISSWAYHGMNYYNHGRLGSSSGAAWAAGAGMVGGLHGGGLAAAGGLSGASRIYVTGRGMGVGASWNAANPWR